MACHVRIRMPVAIDGLLFPAEDAELEAVSQRSDQEERSVRFDPEILLEDTDRDLRSLVPLRLRHLPQRRLLRRYHLQRRERQQHQIHRRMATPPRQPRPPRRLHRRLAMRQARPKANHDVGFQRLPYAISPIPSINPPFANTNSNQKWYSVS